MGIEMVLNELSLRPLAPDRYVAQHRMTSFISTLNRAQSQGIDKSLRTTSEFPTTQLAPDYSLIDWSNDQQVDRDTRLFFKRLITKSPFLADLPEKADQSWRYDFKIGSERAYGCGVSYLLGGLCISMRSEPCWEASRISIVVEQMDDSGELSEETVDVVHASCTDHIVEHRDWIRERLRSNIASGADMWRRREQLFPSLVFCDSVENQIVGLDYGAPMLQPIAKRLLDLEASCQNWKQGRFDPMSIPGKVSLESEATLKVYGQERTFLCPDGKERLFNWHLKINTPPWRIHFDFDEAKPGKIIIGYIGKHLRTISDPT